MFLIYPYKQSIVVRSGLLGGQKIDVPLLIQVLVNFSFIHRLANMRKCSVLQENDRIPSFSLQVFNLCGKIIFKHILVNASNNGALHKKETAYNTVTKQPHKTFTFAGPRTYSRISFGCTDPHIRQLCWLLH
jgi:hypothetical protein